MPGKYLEYIKAGRYVVPVELSFLPSKEGGDGWTTTMTSKWVERNHWKEVKVLLKPAVESVGKYNEQEFDKVSKKHKIVDGPEILLGYTINLNKDKSPFLAVLDPKKNVWTEDEEDDWEVVENTGIADFGGRHKSYTPTKFYIKAVILKKSGSELDDGKRIRKELGVKGDDIRNYCHPLSSSPTSAGSSGTQDKQHRKQRKKKTKMKLPQRTIQENLDSFLQSRSFGSSDSEESLISLPPPCACPSSPPCGIFNPRKLPRSTDPFADFVDDDDLDVGENIDICADEMGQRSDQQGFSCSGFEEIFTSPTLFQFFIDSQNLNGADYDEELRDIEETTSFTKQKRKSKKRSGDKSPSKQTASGLPEIDGPGKRPRTKRKRTVAIVEPMKHTKSAGGQGSCEEPGTSTTPTLGPSERKRRPRSTASPSVERLLGSRSRNTDSAIEIVAGDDELPSDSRLRLQEQMEGTRRNRDSPRKRSAPRYNRLLAESEKDGNLASDESTDSDFEMPVLIKMVPSPGREMGLNQVSPPGSPRPVPTLEPAIALPTNSQEAQESERSPISDHGPISHAAIQTIRRRSLSPDIIEQCMRSSASKLTIKPRFRPQVPRRAYVVCGEISFPSPTKTRTRHVSDSDDITSESAYRKTPIVIRRKRKRKTPRPSSGFSSDITSMKDPVNVSHVLIRSDEETRSQMDSIVRTATPSPMKQIGDAQTQTAITIQDYHALLPRPEPEPSTDAETRLVPIRSQIAHHPTQVSVKIERQEQPQNYDSDAPESDEDDIDVLFDGQYQAIPVVTLDSPSADHEDSEEDLFSFERSPAVKQEASQSLRPITLSLGSGPRDRSTIARLRPSPVLEIQRDVGSPDDEGDYSFNYVRRSVGRNTNGTDSQNVLNFVDDSSQTDDPIRPPNEQGGDAENLSTYQLMNHPGTLQAGFGFLQRVMTNDSSAYQHLGIESPQKKKQIGNGKKRKNDGELMPPPPAKRPASPDICALSPERQTRRPRLHNKPHHEQGEGDDSSALQQGAGTAQQEQQRSNSPVPGPSSGIRHSFNLRRTSMEISSSEDDGDTEHRGPNYDPYFHEFMSRAQQPEKDYEPQGDEYDMTQSSQCMMGVFEDYPQKSRQCKIHKSNIENLSWVRFREHFEAIKPQILRIFEDIIPSLRNRLYKSKQHCDIRYLKELHCIRPFTSDQATSISSWLNDLLVPYAGADSTLKCADYINYVMRPETLIRIYASVNHCSFETAEMEMLHGPCYEGPYAGR